MRHQRYTILPDEIMQADADRQTVGLAGIALVLALVVVSLFLVRQLRRQSELQDCVLSGMSRCEFVIAAR
jgi:hypothetical protein